MIGELTKGVGQILVDGGIPGVIYGKTTSLTTDEMVALTPYLLEDDRSSGRSRVAISIRLRVPVVGGGDPLIEREEDIFGLLAYLENVVIGGVFVSMVEWWTSQPFGSDSKGRPESAVTYHFTCVRDSRVAQLS